MHNFILILLKNRDFIYFHDIPETYSVSEKIYNDLLLELQVKPLIQTDEFPFKPDNPIFKATERLLMLLEIFA
jgi:hypothetical protein